MATASSKAPRRSARIDLAPARSLRRPPRRSRHVAKLYPARARVKRFPREQTSRFSPCEVYVHHGRTFGWGKPGDVAAALVVGPAGFGSLAAVGRKKSLIGRMVSPSRTGFRQGGCRVVGQWPGLGVIDRRPKRQENRRLSWPVYALNSLLKKVHFASTASCFFPEYFDASIRHLWAFFNGMLRRAGADRWFLGRCGLWGEATFCTRKALPEPPSSYWELGRWQGRGRKGCCGVSMALRRVRGVCGRSAIFC